MSGKLIILSGPSGAGKSTIAKHLLAIEKFNLAFSVSACSRKIREGETDGKDYHFLSVDSFKAKIEEKAFLEWEEVYANHYYGTLKSQVEDLLNSGKNVIFDIDVMGGINIKRSYKERALTLFIEPPSIEALEERLTSRNTETEQNLRKRLNKAKLELSYASKFDARIKNSELDLALAEAVQRVDAFLFS